ncbi:pollen-specific leucine-rich repeat extensin-like protein 3 [Mercurialis annua]|uniref:pollen-specific leucine-rich repeat extensin-like protein 3 n=1 Tax=Mercurialis annua TaxID=3986 RepID=UPI00215FB893|nr:pollen-specific leucine-rich repeat extensin-like protein 3 [Mercurialis annua]
MCPLNMERAIFVLLLLPLLFSLTHSEARKSRDMIKKLKHFDLASLLLQKQTTTYPYVSSPFTLPPYDSLSPIPLPQNTPPFCIYPPQLPSPSSPTSPPPAPPQSLPSPIIYSPSPPWPSFSPPSFEPSPPSGFVPSPIGIVPSPTGFVPSPIGIVPSPTGFVPTPTIFLPPIVYPPPTAPPPPRKASAQALWCVAKPSVPDPIILEAMNYACGSGADCESIQASGSCFAPNTLFAHASYAFNSYWQRTKVAGGTCSFGGTAMLVTVDPSYDGCHFVYN